ncbi:MAG TPA: valine--tRNA ligase [Candidatus Thermoplasmatota archaeon]|nr:valine--tRNA ligase [Candidatus Thermoplasmatota archaeon]
MPDAEKDDAPQTDPAIAAMEEKWLATWEREGVYRFDFADRTRPVFSIDTPPPTVSGKMHIGHAYSYNQMDFVARYKRMRGFNLYYPFGFDDNGLPTERYTERTLGVKLADVGRQEFIRLCLEETKKAEAEMETSWRRIGMSCDWSILYRTIDKPVVKISQASFLDLHAKGRAYRAERPTIWCPDCATAIAQAEMEDKSLPSTFNDIAFDLVAGAASPEGGFKHGDKLVHVELKPGPEANSKPREVVHYHQGAEGKIVISTTRPELIPSCVAIFVHPDDARTKHLVGKKVRVPVGGAEVPVLTSDKVDKETGTGVVMNCTFGDLTDIDWWAANKLPLRISIGPNGKMTDVAGQYAGLGIEAARAAITADLKESGRLLHTKTIEHAVNVHERCGTPIEFLVTKQWFVSYLDMKDQFLANGEAVKWHPEYMRVRYDNWVKGLKWDWCISRQRYFGVPFPVWYCEGCGEARVAKGDELPVDPLVDKPKGACAKCGGSAFKGESDVMDTWATSSLTPQIGILAAADRLGAPGATLGDVSTHPALKRLMPMDLRAQAHEIISFWAFNTVVKAHFHHGTIPWRDTMISGFVKLGKGKKMSKSKGDIVEPLDVIRDYSGDALRYWSAQGASLGEDIIYNPKDLTRGQRLATKLRNVAAFIGKALEGWTPPPATKGLPNLRFTVMDRWVLAEFSRLARSATEAWDDYDYRRALLDTENFLWHVLADHYLESVKYRIYAEDDPTRDAARWTLATVGAGVTKLLAPVLVFSTEEAYMGQFARFDGARSVHVAAWPTPVAEDASALEAGAAVKEVIAAVRNWKSSRKVALNAALPVIEIIAPENVRRALEAGEGDIIGTTRVAGVKFVDASELEQHPVAVEPVQAKIGPKYKQDARAIVEALKAMKPSLAGPDGLEIKVASGATFRLEPGEYVVKTRPSLHGHDVEPIEAGGATLLLREG